MVLSLGWSRDCCFIFTIRWCSQVCATQGSLPFSRGDQAKHGGCNDIRLVEIYARGLACGLNLEAWITSVNLPPPLKENWLEHRPQG